MDYSGKPRRTLGCFEAKPLSVYHICQHHDSAQDYSEGEEAPEEPFLYLLSALHGKKALTLEAAGTVHFVVVVVMMMM
jgi:hypothetical protein